MNTSVPTPIENAQFAVVDVETTGFDPSTDRIVQVAAVVVDGRGNLVDHFETVVKPESPEQYEHGAEHIHGISREMVENGMPLSDALRNVKSFVDGRLFTAHNARFDLGFLRAESQRVGLNWDLEEYVDTLALSRRSDASGERRHSLEELCRHYGIGLERAHEAASDARATASVLFRLIDDLGVRTADELSESPPAQPAD